MVVIVPFWLPAYNTCTYCELYYNDSFISHLHQNECSHRQGFQMVASWKRIWGSNGKTEPSQKSFMADKVLPYWVQCNQPSCRKWRELPVGTDLTLDLIRDFVCGYQEGAKKVS